MRARLLVAPVAMLVALTAGPSTAKKAPLIEDPKGDYPVASADIVTADIVTATKGKGSLVITLNLDAAPSTSTPYSYWVAFVVGDCNFLAALYHHPLDAAFTTSGVGCTQAGETSLPEGNVKVSGSTITWTVPLTGELKKGATATDITAGTAPTGMISGGIVEALGDAAATDKSYKIGS